MTPRSEAVAGWHAERISGTVRQLHDRPQPQARAVRRMEPTDTALVLGSTQPDSMAAPAAAAEVARRHSGGGAVLVVPGEVVWVDVIIPRNDPLWDDDVNRSSWWLGDVWAQALQHLGVAGQVHRTGWQPGEWGKLVCFAGRGPGEVIAADGAKLVGLAQRRTRSTAHFQTMLYRRWEPAETLSRLAPHILPPLAQEHRDLAARLAPMVAVVPAEGDEIFNAFLSHLPV